MKADDTVQISERPVSQEPMVRDVHVIESTYFSFYFLLTVSHHEPRYI